MSVNKIFLNLSVSKKLMGGFGIVLLILLSISIVSYQSMVSLVERFNLVSKVSEIDTLVNAARIEEKEFVIRQQNSAVEANAAHISQIISLAEVAAEGFNTVESQQLIADLKQSANDYQTSFTQFQSLATANLNRQAAMEVAARRTVELLNTIEQQLTRESVQLIRSSGNETQLATLQLSNLAGDAAKVMLNARKDEKNFVMRQDQENAQLLQQHIDLLQDKIVQLKTQLPNSEVYQQLQLVMQQLTNYQQQFDAYQAAIDQSKLAENQMREHARATVQLATESVNRQMARLESQARNIELIIIIAAIAAILFGMLTSALITRAIVGPLRQVVDVADKIAEGDLTENLPTDRRDELGLLMQSMQKMTENLRNLIAHLSSGISQLASATEEMAAISTQNAAGASEQRAETEQAATAMNEMTTTVQEVARSAEEASAAATESAAQAKIGEQVIKDTMLQIKTLVAEVTGSSSAIQTLLQQTANIGSILDVIKNVAEQTNLLALNAAIEAARAGDAGRGFAVVADEVRSLAFRTQESTVQIEDLINTLQQKAEDAAKSMSRSSSLADTTRDSAEQAGEAIDTITAAIGSIQQMNQQIAAAALEQSTVAEEINKNIYKIKDISEQSATASEETAAASADLSRLGTELQGLAASFTLEKRVERRRVGQAKDQDWTLGGVHTPA